MPSTFINEQEISVLLDEGRRASKRRIEEVLTRARQMKGLSLSETAVLVGVKDKEIWQEIFSVAKQIKERIYGNRIVLFAPLYVSNRCANDCAYCGFRRSNDKVIRLSLSAGEIENEVLALENAGHKRLLMVYGEHPIYDIDYIVETIETAYKTKTSVSRGEIRRINVNAAPMLKNEYKELKRTGIGTYQVFQETYHRGRYADIHPEHTVKGDYEKRLYAMHSAMEAGIDDVGIGILFGLYDWRFEVMGMLAHSLELEKQFGVGPHTISFPRLEPAINTPFYHKTHFHVSDDDIKKIAAIIRLMVPYTGMILTAREKPLLRRKLMHLGISQIDGGSRIDIGGYGAGSAESDPAKEQFTIYDTRTLDDIVSELIQDGFIPSFCTACYRSKRTGKRFMEIAKGGGVKDLCETNAIISFYEYLMDFASPSTHSIGVKLIEQELSKKPVANKSLLFQEIVKIRQGRRDIFQ